MNAKPSDAEMSEKEEAIFKAVQWAVLAAVLIGLGAWAFVAVGADEGNAFEAQAAKESVANHRKNLQEDSLLESLRFVEDRVDSARREVATARTPQEIALAQDELAQARAEQRRIERKLDEMGER